MIPQVDDLNLEQKVGQIVCFGWSADEGGTQSINGHARALVGEMLVGSVVLMGRNISDPGQARDILAELQSLTQIPVLVCIDQEGGVVNRFREPLHQFPGNMALGAIAMANPESALEMTRAQAAAQAKELRALGIHWNFAPVADVNNNPDNPIIGVRSYGENPEMVAWLAAAALDGYQENGVLACAKHFPGHGDTSVDSHLALPTVRGDWDRISAIELTPFRSVIEHGVGSIMTSHILFPALDASAPATLSAPLLTGLLRNRMEYQGLVITDCLEMDAIAATVGTPQGAVQAIRAGADVALVCHTRTTQQETVNALLNAVDYGDIPESRLNEAVSRVLDAKRRYVSSAGFGGEPWQNPEHDTLEDQIARHSITIVRNAGAIPMESNGKIVVVSAHKAGAALAETLKALQQFVEFIALDHRFPDGETAASLAAIAERSKEIGNVVVCTAPREPWSENPIDVERQAAAVRQLYADFGERLIAVALREPYDIRRYPEVQNYICGYGYSTAVLKALAAALTGQFQPTASLPVSLGDQM